MLKKGHRLKRKEIELFFGSRARYSSGRLLVLRYLKTKNRINRFAFVVSGPKGRFAAQRNLLRRRLAEIIRLRLDKIPGGWDVILFLKLKNQKIPSYSELERDLDYVLSRTTL